MAERPDPQVLASASRRLSLARSYVEGLERRSKRLDSLEADYLELNWEAITLAAHVLTQHRLLKALIAHLDASEFPNEKMMAIADEVLDGSGAIIQRFWDCPCGHSKFDHDELGCVYTGCKPICGT